jgi:hypothetical protein
VPSEVSSIKLDQLVYVELEANNGGMMLTVSEEGFSFRAVTPVRATGRTPFSFTINGTQKLSGFGKIEWTRDEGKVAGLQFTDVSSQFHQALRTWLAQLGSPAVSSSTELLTSKPTLRSASEGVSGTPSEPVPDPQPVGLNFGRSLGGGLPDAVVAPPVFERNNNAEPPRTFPALTEWKYPEDPGTTESPRVNRIAIAAGAIFLLALGLFLYGYRTGIGESLISVGQKLSGPSENTSSAGGSATQATVSDKLPTAPSTDLTNGNLPSASAEKQGLAPATGDRDTQINSVSAAESRKATDASRSDNAFEDARAKSLPAETSGTNTRDAAGQSHGLWADVAKGNTSAEVTLAKLYLIGSGVPKSCAQAKVLLQAAAKKGNVEAIDKLAQLRRQGCP